MTIIPISNDGIKFCRMKLSAFLANITMFSPLASEKVLCLFMNCLANLSTDPVSAAEGCVCWGLECLGCSSFLRERVNLSSGIEVGYCLLFTIVMVDPGLFGDVRKSNCT